jgi:hypothetical protein
VPNCRIQEAKSAGAAGTELAKEIAVVTGVDPSAATLDRERQRAMVTARQLPGAPRAT